MNDHDIEIAIDEVLLDGPFGARSRVIREALSSHLTLLIAERGLPEGAPRELHIARASFDVPAELGPEAVARRVAEGLYERLGGARGGRR